MFLIELLIFIALTRRLNYLEYMRYEGFLRSFSLKARFALNIVIGLQVSRCLLTLAVAVMPLFPSASHSLLCFFLEVILQTVLDPVIDFVTGITLAQFFLAMGRHMEKRNLLILTTHGREQESDLSSLMTFQKDQMDVVSSKDGVGGSQMEGSEQERRLNPQGTNKIFDSLMKEKERQKNTIGKRTRAAP
jgi:hypothetical protein